MKQILKLVFLLVIGQTAFAQAPSNYTNINGRYRWIAGMFDSTFHIPKGSTPSLRTGGSTNAGALFYRTSDSTVRYWTGSQWLTLSDTTRFVPYVGATKDVDLNSWSLNAKSLHIKGTAGQGHLGLKFQSATPNMSASESGVYADANGNLGIKIDNAYTSIFKTNLNSADRTYTFQNKNYTVADSADVAAKIEGTLISGYLTKATGTKTIDTSQIYQTNGKIGIGRTNPTAKVDITDSLGTALRVTNIGPYGVGGDGINVRVNGWSGYAALIEQRDSSAAGTQYQTVFRKGMLPGYGNPAPGGGVAFITQIGGENEVYKNLTVYRGRMIDSTGYSVGQVKGSSQEIWTRKNGVWDTTLVLNQGNVGVNTGQNGIDSALTVANGTWLKRGVRMSALPTGVGTKSVRIDANGTLSVADTLANGVSGSGTTNYVSKFTGTNAIGNSQIFDNGSAVGINTITPTSGIRLDVNGNIQAKNEITVQGRDSDGLGTISLNDVSSSFSYLQGVPNDNEFRFWVRSNGKYRFSIDNTEMIRVNTTGVGIGTTTPDSLLTVNLGTHLKRGVRMSGLPTGTGTKSLRVDANGTVSLADTLANGISGTGTTNYIPKFTGSTSIGNSAIYDASGSIGIGTITPVHPLDVINTGGTGISTRNAETNYSILRIGTDVSNGYAFIQSGNAGTGTILPLAFRFGSNERMRLDASGNLGIGTSSPISLLTTSSSSATTGLENGLQASLVSTAGATDDKRVELNFRFTGDTKNKNNIIGADNNVGGNGDIYFAPFSWGSNAPIERMRLDGNGNLGLGVTPSAWSNGGNLQLPNDRRISFSGVYGEVVSNAYYNAGWKYYGTGAAADYSQSAGQHIWYNAPSGTAGNAISFTQAMTLTSGGNLLVGGTSDNGSRLQITGAATFSNSVALNAVFNSTANTPYIRFDESGASKFYIGQRGAVSGSGGTGYDLYTVAGNDLRFFTGGSSTTALCIDINRNVGISTTSPAAKLDIIQTWNATPAIRLSDNTTNTTEKLGRIAIQHYTTSQPDFTLLMGSSNAAENAIRLGGGTAFSNAATLLQFYTASNTTTATGTERMRITSGGNVGIGTTSPTTYTGYTTLALNNATNGGLIDFMAAGSVLAQIYATTSYLSVGSFTNMPVRFMTNNAEVARFNTSGELLINTTSDAGDYKLQVNGNVYAAGSYRLYGNGKSVFWENSSSGVNHSITTDSGGNFSILAGSNTIYQILYASGNYYNYFNTSVGVGTTSPNASALLDVSSTTKGFLPPRMTGAQAEAIATPAAGLMIYANSGNGTTITSTGWWGYDGTTWVKLN